MKPEPETLRSNADGEIPAQPFTGEQDTLFQKTYLSGPSVYDRLHEDEAIQYLLVNRSSGVTIDATGSAETTTHAPDSDLHSLAAVTDHRILFLTGQTDGDTTISLSAGEITGANIESSLLSTAVHIETKTRMYTFPVRKRDSSEPAAAVAYVQDYLVPTQPSTGPDTPPQSDAASADEQTASDPQQGSSDPGSDSAFIASEQQLAVETREHFRTASQHIRATNPEEDDLREAIESLETAKEEFESIVDAPGINSEKVSETIERLDSLLEPLHRIQSAISEGNRKLTLAKESSHVPAESLKDTRSTIKEAIDVAEKVGRTSTRLEELREQVEAELESATQQSEAKKNTTDTSAEQQHSGEKWQKPATADTTGPDGAPDVSGQDSAKASQEQADIAAGDVDGTAEGTDASTPTDQKDAAEDTDAPDEDDTSGEDASAELERLSGVDGPTATALQKAGYDSISDIQAASKSELTKIKGISRAVAALIKVSADETGTAEQVEQVEDVTREDIIEEVEQISDKMGGYPTMSEFETQTVYDNIDIYEYFDSWDDVIDAAEPTAVTRETLLEDLRRLKSELGFPPLSSHIEEHGQFSTYDYQREFGSVDDALQVAGFDVEAHIIETLETVVEEVETKPNLTEFVRASPYSSSVIYKFFDSWQDAIATVTDDDESGSDDMEPSKGEKTEPSETDPRTASTAEDVDPQQNELSERYELTRNLKKLCRMVTEARAESEPDGDDADPMVMWEERVAGFYSGNSVDSDSYGSQQATHNPFSISEYREEFGNGQRVTEFRYVQAAPLTASVQTLLSPHTDSNLETYHLPVDPETGARFPVIVESQAELERATEMLNRLPLNPEPAAIDQDEGDEDDSERGATGSQPTTGTSSNGTSQKREAPLTQVRGITDSVAQALQQAGYQTRDDLQDASTDDLAAVDGVNEQVAMRIKVNVGG